MSFICRIAEMNRGSYYAWLKRPASKREQQSATLLEKIKVVHSQSKGIYGVPRVTAQLHLEGQKCGRNRIAHLMRKEGLFGCARRKFRPVSTTDSNHNLPIAPRVFKVEEEETFPSGANQVWVGDQTYIATQEGWLYLTTVMDVFNRKVVGNYMSDHLRSETVWKALKMGIQNEKEALDPGQKPTLIYHSDRGSQYASEYYRQKLALLGVTQSMSRSGNCYDNAYAESFFHTLKVELVHRRKFTTRAEAQREIEEYINWYNSIRLHSSLGYQTPMHYKGEAVAA